ncbi:MAG TPA: hypothetical protein VGO80_10585 [Solirubrobacteraceae bacterium]|nr:hypothetical protein [Solirubrobacteraceae bacterium]
MLRLRPPRTACRSARARIAAAAAIAAAIAIAVVAPAAARVLPQPPPARPLPSPAYVTDKAVNALARSADTIYLGGEFSRIGPPTGGGVVLDPTDGLRATQFPELRGIGFAIVPDGAGGYYVGGRFANVGGLPRKNLAHVLASGAVDPSFAPHVDDDVLALALDGGRLYVGGDFLHVGDVIRRRLAALDPATGAVVGAFNPGADQSVQDLAIAGSRMFVNGRFTGIAGHSRSGIAVLDTHDGELDPAFDAVPNGKVDAVLALGSRFYVGGTFTEVSGRSRAGLAAFDIATGELDPAFSPSTNGNVYHLATDGTRLFVAGHFTEIGRAFNNAVASLDPITGEASQAFRLFLDKDAYTLAMVGSRLFIGGEFTKVNEQPRNRLAAVDLVTGSVDPAFDPDPDDDVYALAVAGGGLVAGGKFTSAPRTKVNHLAAVNAVSGEPIAAWAAGTDGVVSALAVADGRVFAGGRFATANGAKRRGLAGFDPGSGALDVLDVPVRGALGTLAADAKRLYLGGSFDRVGGRFHPALAAIDLDANKVAPRFNAPRSLRRASFRFASIRAIVPDGRRVLVGGDVSVSRTIGPKNKRHTQSRNGVVAVDRTDASVDYAFNSHVDGTVQALVRSGDTIYIGGQLSRPSGTRIVKLKPRKGKKRLRKIALFRYNLVAASVATGELRRAFRPAPDSEVVALAASSSQLYLAGRFQLVGRRRRGGLAAVDPASGKPVTLFSPQPAGGDRGIAALLAAGASVYAAGDFDGFGLVPRANFAIIPAAPAPA